MPTSLRETLTAASRAAAVDGFLRTWHGIPDIREVPTTPQVPSLLARLLRLCQSNPAICSKQNRLISPVEVGDRLLCFYVENQGVYRWAYRPDGDDPVVLGKPSETDDWLPEQERLTGFLLQVCLFEALFSAPYTASAAWLPAEALANVLDRGRLRPILTPWRWPENPTAFLASDGAIGITSERHEEDGSVGGFDVMLAALDLEPLAYLPEIIQRHGDHWEHARLAEFVW
jgi:hypothetical protein